MQPLNYLQSTEGIIWVLVCIPLGFLLTALAYLVINKVPAKWLCDYNEIPSPELLSGKRVSYRKSGIIVSFIMSLVLVMCRLQFNKGYDIYFILLTIIIFFCIMIAVSDMKYTIIPDQFTVAVGISGLVLSVYDIARGYNILHNGWWSPIVGALIGAAVMILIDLLGMWIYKQDGMGFGDVKLFFAVGLFTGFPGTIYTIILAIITAAVCFVVIILVSSKSSGKIEEQPNDTKEETKETKEEITTTDAEEKTEISSDTDAQQDLSENSAEADDEVSGNSQLAFGPYIAIAVIAYAALFDIINYLVGLYINLF